MIKKKIYIAGKVTGEPIAECTMKFGEAQNKIEALGFTAVNPLEIVGTFNISWQDAMRKCIKSLMDCDAVLLLPDAFKSKGAITEMQLAIRLDIKITHYLRELEEWKSNL